MRGTAWVARPDSRSWDLESRASWVGPSPAGLRTQCSWLVFLESINNSKAQAAGRRRGAPLQPHVHFCLVLC